MTHRLMICGSREASPALLWQAWSAAQSAFRMNVAGWEIVVGDAHGVDAEVVRTAQIFDIPYTVVGIALHPRNGASMRHYMRLVTVSGVQAERYRERDRYLVQQADRIICLTNGQTERRSGQLTGTLAVYEYAKRLNKQVELRGEDWRAHEPEPSLTPDELVQLRVIEGRTRGY